MRTLMTAAALCVAFAVSGCVEIAKIAPALTPDERHAYRVDKVEVLVPDTSEIWWGSGDRQVATAAGKDWDPDGDNEASSYLESAEGKAALHELVCARIARRAEPGLGPMLSGETPAQMSIRVESVQVSSAAQQILVGGHQAYPRRCNCST